MEVVVLPGAFDAVPQVQVALVPGEERVIPHVHDLHVELVAVLRVALESVLCNQCTNDLLVVGLDKDTWLFKDLLPLPVA